MLDGIALQNGSVVILEGDGVFLDLPLCIECEVFHGIGTDGIFIFKPNLAVRLG